MSGIRGQPTGLNSAESAAKSTTMFFSGAGMSNTTGELGNNSVSTIGGSTSP